MSNKTQIKLTIENDYNSNLSHQLKTESIQNLLTELDLFCEVSNHNFYNIIKELQPNKTYKDDYKDSLIVNAKGYYQGDWQEYKIFYNKKDTNIKTLNCLVDELEKSFTHEHDYIAKVNELIIINDKTYIGNNAEYYSFYINDIEFPNQNDVLNEFNYIYGIKYDILEIDID